MTSQLSAQDTTGDLQIANGTWRKSSFSNGPDALCVEVKVGREGVAIRDSKDRAGPVLRFSQGEWRAFLQGARAGEFEP